MITGLIVSVQPKRQWGKEILKYAEDAVACGITTIRIEGEANIKAVKTHFGSLEIIGLIKRPHNDVEFFITPELSDAKKVIDAGADYVAFDATARRKDSSELGKIVFACGKSGIADCSNLDDAAVARSMGCKMYTTALSGYVSGKVPKHPDLAIIGQISMHIGGCIIAEGRYNSELYIRSAFKHGANAVCIGDAICDPVKIIKNYMSFCY